MSGPHPSVALTRLAVRTALQRTFSSDAAGERRVVAGVSGGADSMALAAALAFEAPKQGVAVDVVIVDHGLQAGSADVAERARRACVDQLGFADDDVRTVAVIVDADAPEGLEAAARAARRRALFDVADAVGAARAVLAHTADDQAEQVLLGLMRGSGTRALAGMRADRARLLRPFLLGPEIVPGGPVRRVDTELACEALGLEPWHDPHNDDPAFSRVRARHTLAALERELAAPTLRRSLFRTAAAAGRDADLLDRLTDEALARSAGTDDAQAWPATWSVVALVGLDPALRIRALRRLLVLHGARDAELSSGHLFDVERLLVAWSGQGPIDVPGSVEVRRVGGEMTISPRRKGE
ncbi:tRNA lysidine(34) synthetase TilS [Dermacoccus nishinomiyaensis]